MLRRALLAALLVACKPTPNAEVGPGDAAAASSSSAAVDAGPPSAYETAFLAQKSCEIDKSLGRLDTYHCAAANAFRDTAATEDEQKRVALAHLADPNASLRCAAGGLLAGYSAHGGLDRPSDARAALAEALRTEKDPLVLICLLHAIDWSRRQDPTPMTEQITAATKNASPDVRMHAYIALAHLPNGAATIGAALKTEEAPDVLVFPLVELGETNAADAVPVFNDVLENSKSSVAMRAAAFRALVRMWTGKEATDDAALRAFGWSRAALSRTPRSAATSVTHDLHQGLRIVGERCIELRKTKDPKETLFRPTQPWEAKTPILPVLESVAIDPAADEKDRGYAIESLRHCNAPLANVTKALAAPGTPASVKESLTEKL